MTKGDPTLKIDIEFGSRDTYMQAPLERWQERQHASSILGDGRGTASGSPSGHQAAYALPATTYPVHTHRGSSSSWRRGGVGCKSTRNRSWTPALPSSRGSSGAVAARYEQYAQHSLSSSATYFNPSLPWALQQSPDFARGRALVRTSCLVTPVVVGA